MQCIGVNYPPNPELYGKDELMLEVNSALVAGATGFIGSSLVKGLTARGIEIYCLIRSKSLNLGRLKGVSGIRTIEIESYNNADLAKALSTINADVIFNLASYGVNQKDRDPELMLRGNVDLVSNLLIAAKAMRIKRFIHTGSYFEYAEPFDNKPISENQSIKPMSLYGAAKAASVIYGNALASNLDLSFVTLRLFGVYGIGETTDRLIPYLIQQLKHDQPVDLTPGGQVRDLLYIDDVVDALIAAMLSKSLENYSVYNICSGIGVQVREIAETVADAMDKPQALLHFGQRPYRKDEAMWLVGDNKKFSRATNWRPTVSLAEGVRQMVVESGGSDGRI
jgi:nucleoside-diphosphate-sugar epimerase